MAKKQFDVTSSEPTDLEREAFSDNLLLLGILEGDDDTGFEYSDEEIEDAGRAYMVEFIIRNKTLPSDAFLKTRNVELAVECSTAFYSLCWSGEFMDDVLVKISEMDDESADSLILEISKAMVDGGVCIDCEGENTVYGLGDILNNDDLVEVIERKLGERVKAIKAEQNKAAGNANSPSL